LIKDLTPHVNLIIKLHPFLAKFHPAHTYRILEKYKDHPHVFFLEKFPCIYPLLQKCDLYIGDYSSIGYDFLAFNRPLYFLIPEDRYSFQLHSCGMTIPSEGNIYKFLINTWEEQLKGKQEQRQKIYDYAFGRQQDFSQIRENILSALKKKHD
jgi:CDP-glycerol glycerophosphotransferase (TagB/SpsB family)